MSAIRIIDASPAHAAVVAALHAATVGAGDAPAEGGGWSAEWVGRILALPGAAATLALAPDGSAVGFVLCLPAGEALDIAAIGVLPEHRRAGIGRALLRRCEQLARAAGAPWLMLEVAADNKPARLFYEKAGFMEAGLRRGYYRARPGGVRRDAMIFRKSL